MKLTYFHYRCWGNSLKDSGWTSALTQGDIACSGTVDTFIKAIHVAKTRHATKLLLHLYTYFYSEPMMSFPHLLLLTKMKLLCPSKNGVQRERMNVFNLITKQRHCHWRFFYWCLLSRSVRAISTCTLSL